jgi:transcriptional regulator with XRE-family HTH domain
VSRDRASAYAAAASEAAPQAIQVADRFHVCKNLTEATQLLLTRCQAEMTNANLPQEPPHNGSGPSILAMEEWRPKEPTQVKEARLTRRTAREARYEQVRERHAQGLTAKEVACQLGLSQRTVQRWLAAGTFPEAKKRRKKSSAFDGFAPYVLKRWQEGDTLRHMMFDIRGQSKWAKKLASQKWEMASRAERRAYVPLVFCSFQLPTYVKDHTARCRGRAQWSHTVA